MARTRTRTRSQRSKSSPRLKKLVYEDEWGNYTLVREAPLEKDKQHVCESERIRVREKTADGDRYVWLDHASPHYRY